MCISVYNNPRLSHTIFNTISQHTNIETYSALHNMFSIYCLSGYCIKYSHIYRQSPGSISELKQKNLRKTKTIINTFKRKFLSKNKKISTIFKSRQNLFFKRKAMREKLIAIRVIIW